MRRCSAPVLICGGHACIAANTASGEWPLARIRKAILYSYNSFTTFIFSVISYIYLKIPDSEPPSKIHYVLPFAYPFSYPFFANLLKFPLKLQQVTENKDFSKKIFIFSAAHIFFLVPELFLAMQLPACQERVFFIYGCANSFLNHFLLPLLRSPP